MTAIAKENVFETDVLVIGGGLSGLFAAIKAQEEGANVTIVEKGYAGKAGAAIFSSMASIFNPEWGHDLKVWMDNIAKAGDYMNNPEWTEITLKESYGIYKDIESWGLKIPKEKDGMPVSVNWGFIHLQGFDWRSALLILRRQAIKSGADIMDRIMVTGLLKQDGKVVGAVGFHTRNGEFYVFKAKATIICTGSGLLGINDDFVSSLSTYEGEAIAYQAGAEISGKEFGLSGTGPYRYTDMGFGGYGVRSQGDDRVSLEGKEIKPAPRGFHVSMLVDKHVDSEGYKVNRLTLAAAAHSGRAPFYWNLDDATQLELDMVSKIWSKERIEAVRRSVDMSKGGLYRAPVRFECYVGWPLHSASGISSADTRGGTSLPGLFAAGDVYNSKAIGARYTGGGTRNAAVTGCRAGRGAAEYAKKSGKISVDPAEVDRLKKSTYAPMERKGGFDHDWVELQLKTIVYPYYVLFIKHGDRLKAALTMVEFVKNHLSPQMYADPRDAHGLRLAHEAKGSVTSIEMMLRSSIFRTESRGVHYREDYPFRDDPNWLAEVKIKEKDGKMELVRELLPKKWWPDLSIPYRERYPSEYLGEIIQDGGK